MRYRNEPIYTGAIAAGRAMFGALRIKRTVIGAEHLPDEGGAVIAMTHFGYMEFALVEWVMWLHNRRRIRFMAKKPVFDKKPVGALMRNMKHISVDMKAGAGAYSAAVAALQTGELIGVFPEAGVSASMVIRDLKTGAARLAAEAGVPLIPIAVWGGQRLMTKGHKTTMRDRIGAPIVIVVGEPITVSAAHDPAEATATLREALERLLVTAQKDFPLDGAGQWWQPRSLGGTAPTPAEAAAAEVERAAQREKRAKLVITDRP
jgi:1-acyl-sn-glycerol-3-phosphate acyltransferase